MTVPSTLADLNTTAALNSPAGSDAVGNTLDDFLRAIQAIVKAESSSGSDIASTATISPPASGSFFIVTGNTGISAIDSTYSWNGRKIWLKFSSNPVLTNSGTLILKGSANITAAAGDVYGFEQDSSGTWRMFSKYTLAELYALTGLATASGLTMSTAKVLGRATAATGAIEELAVTGTGSVVLAVAPTITGHPTIEGVTSTGATGTGKFVFDNAPTITGHPTIEGVTSTGATGTGNFVFSASPTLSGTIAGTYALGGTPTINVATAVGGTWTAASTWTIPAHTLGGAITGNGQNVSGLGTLGVGAITSSGNIALGGYTLPADYVYAHSLHASIYGTFVGNENSGYMTIANNAYLSTSNETTGWIYTVTGGANRYVQKQTGGHVFSTAISGTGGTGITWVDAASITSTGINSTAIGATTASTGAFTTGSWTKAAAGDVMTWTNGGATPGTGYLYSGSQLIALSYGAGVTQNALVMDGTSTRLLGPGQTATAAVTSTGLAVTGTLTETGGSAWTDYTPTVSTDTGTSGTLTITSARYRLLGKTLFLNLAVSATVASGSPTEIRITLPGGVYAQNNNQYGPAWISSNGVAENGFFRGTTTGGGIRFSRNGGAAFVTSWSAQVMTVLELQ